MSDLEARFEEVTPTKAVKWLETVNHDNQAEIQRPLRKSWINHLAKEMLLDRFAPSSTIYFGFQNGTTYLLNGQHTLHAIVESGKAQTLPIVRHKAKDVKELKQIYYRADGGLKRTFADSIRALDAIKVTGISNYGFQLIDSALRFTHAGFTRSSIKKPIYSYDDRVSACMMWVDEYNALQECIAGGVQQIVKTINNRAVFSVALITLRQQRKKGKEFWHQVAYDDMLSAKDPRKVFGRWLITAHSVGGTAASANNIFTSESFCYATSRAWNAFFEGRELSRIIPSHKQVTDISGIALTPIIDELDEVYNLSLRG